MKARLHFHSDCAFFAGSENMLVNFLNSASLRRDFVPSIGFRAGRAYEDGLRQRVKTEFIAEPLALLDPALIRDRLSSCPAIIRGMARALAVLSLQNYWMNVVNVLRLRALFRRLRPDIVHINNGGYPGALSCSAAAIAARLAGVRHVVMVVNNLAVPYAGIRRRLDYPVDRMVVRCVEKFITGSGPAAARLQDVLSLPDARVLPMHNGIGRRASTESAGQTRRRLGLPESGTVCFGVVALLEPRKGHKILVEAAARLIAHRGPAAPGLQFLFEGSGPERDAIESLIQARGLTGRVRLIGMEDNIANFMQAVDVLVLPSINHEDFPNVVIEAMALGKPVIASRLAGTPEQVVDGETGLLVEPGDVDGLADAVGSLADDEALRSTLGGNGKARFERLFTAEIAVERYHRLYLDLLKEEPR